MNILGLNAFHGDSSAALVKDGVLVAAVEEERFRRVKHWAGFPSESIAYCLREAGIGASDLDLVCFYDKPLKKFERLLETYFAYAPAGYRSFRQALPVWMQEKLHLPREMDKGLQVRYKGRYVFTDPLSRRCASLLCTKQRRVPIVVGIARHFVMAKCHGR